MSQGSPMVSIDTHPPLTTPPILETPLYHCQRRVTVMNVHVGSEVQVFAKTKRGVGPISARKTFNTSVDSIEVAPHLQCGQDVWVLAIGCGSALELLHVPVLSHPPIDPPQLREPVTSGETWVRVTSVIPTATVLVYVQSGD